MSSGGRLLANCVSKCLERVLLLRTSVTRAARERRESMDDLLPLAPYYSAIVHWDHKVGNLLGPAKR